MININFNKPKHKYYAIALESSYDVKNGTIQEIPEKELDTVLKTGKFKFSYSSNMHWFEDELRCTVVKETISYEIIK